MSEVVHPDERGRLAKIIDSVRAIRDSRLSICAKACFLDKDGKTLTRDGERLLADLREKSRLFRSGITRSTGGAIDKDELLRLEGRREIVLRIINLLELDPQGIAHLVEVDDGRK